MAFLSGFVKSRRSTSGNYDSSPEPDSDDPEHNFETSSSDDDCDLHEAPETPTTTKAESPA
ncbi:unnamed protein product, partial [Allacma fusca]